MAIANIPGNDGNASVAVSWLLAFRVLDTGVHFVDRIDHGRGVGRDKSAVAFFRRTMACGGLPDTATLPREPGTGTDCRSVAAVPATGEEADRRINMSGRPTARPLLRRIPRQASVHLDPGFAQFWHTNGLAGARLRGRDMYLTRSANSGASDSAIDHLGGEAGRAARRLEPRHDRGQLTQPLRPGVPRRPDQPDQGACVAKVCRTAGVRAEDGATLTASVQSSGKSRRPISTRPGGSNRWRTTQRGCRYGGGGHHGPGT
jgi:hypothetical protein